MKHLFCLCTLVLAFLCLQAGHPQGPIKVEVRDNNGTFQLYRDGKPYFIKGGGGNEHLDRLIEAGGNSIRTWSMGNAEAILDEAHAKGLTVMMGIWVGHERHGFDYNDGKAVKGQLAGFREAVMRIKDHPALLLWGIGNECDLFYSNFKVWNAINDIAKMIHEVDPNHPTATITAGIDAAEIALIKERAPHIDILGVNTYGGIYPVHKQVRAYGWDKPYLITEWGHNGAWEVAKTKWNAAIEPTSTDKASAYKDRYQKGISADPKKCIGSYAFLWGWKQELTPTWFGLFSKDGVETQAIEELEYAWSGKYPQNRAPQISGATLNDMSDWTNVRIKARGKYVATIEAKDPDNDPLKYVWEFLPEATNTKVGGDAEATPDAVKNLSIRQEPGELVFRAPNKTGAYRLFIYVYDSHNHVATVNIPFWVE